MKEREIFQGNICQKETSAQDSSSGGDRKFYMWLCCPVYMSLGTPAASAKWDYKLNLSIVRGRRSIGHRADWLLNSLSWKNENRNKDTKGRRPVNDLQFNTYYIFLRGKWPLTFWVQVKKNAYNFWLLTPKG